MAKTAHVTVYTDDDLLTDRAEEFLGLSLSSATVTVYETGRQRQNLLTGFVVTPGEVSCDLSKRGTAPPIGVMIKAPLKKGRRKLRLKPDTSLLYSSSILRALQQPPRFHDAPFLFAGTEVSEVTELIPGPNLTDLLRWYNLRIAKTLRKLLAQEDTSSLSAQRREYERRLRYLERAVKRRFEGACDLEIRLTKALTEKAEAFRSSGVAIRRPADNYVQEKIERCLDTLIRRAQELRILPASEEAYAKAKSSISSSQGIVRVHEMVSQKARIAKNKPLLIVHGDFSPNVVEERKQYAGKAADGKPVRWAAVDFGDTEYSSNIGEVATLIRSSGFSGIEAIMGDSYLNWAIDAYNAKLKTHGLFEEELSTSLTLDAINLSDMLLYDCVTGVSFSDKFIRLAEYLKVNNSLSEGKVRNPQMRLSIAKEMTRNLDLLANAMTNTGSDFGDETTAVFDLASALRGHYCAEATHLLETA